MGPISTCIVYVLIVILAVCLEVILRSKWVYGITLCVLVSLISIHQYFVYQRVTIPGHALDVNGHFVTATTYYPGQWCGPFWFNEHIEIKAIEEEK